MVRPGRRKGLEEVYGSKLDAIHPVKSHLGTGMAITKSATMRTDRTGITGGGGGTNGMGMGIGGQVGAATNRKPEQRTQRSFVTANDYYITTNLPITASNLRNASSTMTQGTHTSNMSSGVQANPYASPYNVMSSRRGNMAGKGTSRQSQQSKVPHFSLPENKVQGASSVIIKPKDQQHQHQHQHQHQLRLNGGHNKTMTQRSSYATATLNAIDTNTGNEFSDKELMLPNTVGGRTRRSHSHQHQHGQIRQHQVQTHPLQHQLHQQQQSNYGQTHDQVHQKHMHAALPNPNSQNTRQHKAHISGQGPVTKIQVTPADDEDDKDDDPDEFFELIRQTVQTAIGSTISEILNSNFRDLSHKMDRFSGELKLTNDHLEKLQDQVTNKVVHYGEENSRHFRYLCMKSEYDKMFYQHHTMLAGKPQLPMEADARASQVTLSPPQHQTINLNPMMGNAGGGAANNEKPKTNFKYSSKLAKHLNAQKMNNSLKKEINDGIKVQNPCACHSTSKATHQQQRQSPDTHNSVSDQSVSVRSSELGRRQVLGHIQCFCAKDDQMPYNLEDVMKPKAGMAGNSSEESTLKAVSSNADRKDRDSDLETAVDSMDETYNEMDEFQYSSDDMSTGSDDDSDVKYPSGANTARAPLKATRMTTRFSHKGAGDGQ